MSSIPTVVDTKGIQPAALRGGRFVTKSGSYFLRQDVCQSTPKLKSQNAHARAPFTSICRNPPLHVSTCSCAIAYQVKGGGSHPRFGREDAEAAEVLLCCRGGAHSAPAPSTSTGRLSLSYQSLRYLILALAQWAAGICDGDTGLLDSNHFTFSCQMVLSVSYLFFLANPLSSTL